MSDDFGTRPLPVGKLPAALLGRLVAAHGSTDPAVLVGPGIGRDAAAIRLGDVVLVAKTDPITFATRSAAAYLVDVNANDLACLGATPRWLLATALLPEGMTAGAVEEQFAELFETCARRRISLVGGHTEVTTGIDRTILVGLLLGETTEERLLRPGGAQPGDRLLLTKGLAVEGTALLANELGDRLAAAIGPGSVERAVGLLADPGISVVRDAEVLLASGGVTALHDPTEGGLATAVRELATAAGCGAEVERSAVPVIPETAAIARALGLDPLGMLGSGALLAAVPARAVGSALAALRSAGIDAAEIGELLPEGVPVSLRTHDGQRPLRNTPEDEVARFLASRSGPGSASR